MTRLSVFLGTGACVLATALPVLAQRGPAPVPQTLSADVMSLACAPALAYEMPAAALHISGGQESVQRQIHAPGDLVTINAGTRDGITVGQEFYTRRVLKSDASGLS